MFRGSTYAAVAVKISVLEVPGGVRLISPSAKRAVKSAIYPRIFAFVCILESTVIATMGKRQATSVATREVNRSMTFMEYVTRVGPGSLF